MASALLAGVLSSGLWESRESRAAEPLDLTCSAQTPTVPLGGAVTVKAWARSPAGRALRYTWTATAGRIEGRGAEAVPGLDNGAAGDVLTGRRVDAGQDEMEVAHDLLDRAIPE